MNRHATLRAAFAAILVSAAGAAAAHPGIDGGAHHGFLGGFAHPFTGLDHLVAILAVGFWSASLGRRGWQVAAAFPFAMLAGALLAVGGFAVPAIEPMIAVSLLVVGLLTAMRTPIAEPAAAALVVAVRHGTARAAAGALRQPPRRYCTSSARIPRNTVCSLAALSGPTRIISLRPADSRCSFGSANS
ncbi:MAG TPA: HupE/UreJ family protein [Burkholderiaceae bacterium]|nr:HupE/UreJ family protein [Burkholderiaceae bacterium]